MRAFFVLAVLVAVCSAAPGFSLKKIQKLLANDLTARSQEGDELKFAASAIWVNLELQCAGYIGVAGKDAGQMMDALIANAIPDDSPILDHVCPMLQIIGGAIKDMERDQQAQSIKVLLEEGMCASVVANAEYIDYLVKSGKMPKKDFGPELEALFNEVMSSCEAEFGKDEVGTLIEQLVGTQDSS